LKERERKENEKEVEDGSKDGVRIGKRSNEIEKGIKVWKGVEIGRSRRKWILGKRGRLRIEGSGYWERE
jgi:hypothetical protein